MSEATAFVLKELTGPDQREVRLTSYALPIGGYELRGTMRAEVAHYPGNPDATIQVLGPKEEPSTIEGKWSDRFLGAASIFTVNGAPISSAREATRLVDDVRRKGQLLRVSWDETVRYGIMTMFVQRWARGQDVEWEIELTWVSQDRADALSPVVATTTTPEGVVTAVGASIQAAVAQNGKAGAASDVMASAQGAVSGVRRRLAAAADLNRQAQGYVAGAFSLLAAPGNLSRQVAGLSLAIATQMADALDNEVLALRAAYQFEHTTAATTTGYGTADGAAKAISPENNAVPPSSGQPSALPAGQAGKVLLSSIVSAAQVGATTGPSATGKALAAAVWGVRTEGSLRSLKRTSAVLARELLEQQERDLIAIYVARTDDDLRDVARRYYGDQRYWRGLKVFNDLDGSLLTRGQAVLVPRPAEVGVQ